MLDPWGQEIESYGSWKSGEALRADLGACAAIGWIIGGGAGRAELKLGSRWRALPFPTVNNMLLLSLESNG